MVVTSGRFLDGKLFPVFSFSGRPIFMRLSTSHTIHGNLGQRPGLVYERSSQVRCRLIMHGRRVQVLPNQSLILHCHGAVFVAQSLDSHELYLHDWARKLPGVHILSVDY